MADEAPNEADAERTTVSFDFLLFVCVYYYRFILIMIALDTLLVALIRIRSRQPLSISLLAIALVAISSPFLPNIALVPLMFVHLLTWAFGANVVAWIY